MTSIFLRNAFWSVAGASLSRVFTFLATMYVARKLNVENFGQLGIVQLTIISLVNLSQAAIGTTATKFIAENRDKSDRLAMILAGCSVFTMSSAFLFGSATFLFADYIAYNWYDSISLAVLFKISSLGVFAGIVSTYQVGALAGFERYKYVANINVFSGLLGLPLTIGLTAFAGLSGAAWAIAGTQIIQAVLGHFFLRRCLREVDLAYDRRSWKNGISRTWRFSLLSTLSSAATVPANWLGSTLLAVQTAGFAEMGIFNAANQWRNLALFVPATLNVVYLSTISKMNSSANTIEQRQFIKSAVLVNLAMGLTIFIVGSLFAERLMSTYGPGFVAGVDVFRLMLLSAVVISMNNLFSREALGRGRAFLSAKFDIVWASTYSILALLLVPHFKSLGLALTCVLAAITQLFYQIWERSREPQ